MSPPAIRLPDCRERQDPFTLSARQRRAVIEALASGGRAALDAWLREEERRDPYIRERIKAEHGRLEREAQAEKRRAQEQFAADKQGRETAWERRMGQMQERERELHERIETTRLGPALDINELRRIDDAWKDVLEEPAALRGWWARVALGGLKNLWWLLVLVYVRFVRALRRLIGRPVPEPAATITLPDGMKVSLGGLATLQPGIQARIRYRMKQERGWRSKLRRMWDRLTGREDYGTIAKRLLEEDLKDHATRAEAARRAEADGLEAELRALERKERDERRRFREEMETLASHHQRELERLSSRMEQGPYEHMREELLDMMADAGLVDAQGDPTAALMERFAGMLFDEASRGLPGGGESLPGSYVEGEGEYSKGTLRSLNERGMVELVDSVVNARMRHPGNRHLYDEDLLVHREVRTSRTHVVIIFDTSGSMEAHGRIEAARRVCLVLYRAVKEENPDHRVDLLAMHTSVEAVDLAGCWNAQPKGFTNHGRALREARALLDETQADRKLVYLITDGLPEAMTIRGVDTADRPDRCMPYALEQARLLGDLPGLRTFVIQLEANEPQYVEAARRLARAAGGTMETMDPTELTSRLLVDFETTKGMFAE